MNLDSISGDSFSMLEIFQMIQTQRQMEQAGISLEDMQQAVIDQETEELEEETKELSDTIAERQQVATDALEGLVQQLTANDNDNNEDPSETICAELKLRIQKLKEMGQGLSQKLRAADQQIDQELAGRKALISQLDSITKSFQTAQGHTYAVQDKLNQIGRAWSEHAAKT